MAIYNPPTEILPIFNINNWESGNDISLTQSEADQRYLRLTGGTERGTVFFNSNIFVDNNLISTDITNNRVGINKTPTTYTLEVDGGLDLTTGNAYRIAGNSVLNATTLGSSVVSSSLTTVGTLSNCSITGNLLINSTGGSGTFKFNSSGSYTNSGQGIYCAMQGGSVPAIILCSDTTANRYIGWATSNGSLGASIQCWNQLTSTMDMRFYTGGNNERMRIDASGRVGIGRTPTTSPLEVQGDISLTGDIILKTSGVAPVSGELGFRFTSTPADTNITTGTLKNIASFTLDAGTWSVIVYTRIGNTSGTTNITSYEVGYSTANNTISYTNPPYVIFTSGGVSINQTFGNGATYPMIQVPTFFTLTVSTTIHFNGTVAFTGGSGVKFQDNYIQAVRIA